MMAEGSKFGGRKQMANRIVFFPTSDNLSTLFHEKLIEFEWVPGMAMSQGTKSVINLHRAARREFGDLRILEISTRSQDIEGIQFSAFNLNFIHDDRLVSVESAYQSSKVFEFGGPYFDLMNADPMSAKRDYRLKNSGRLIGFHFNGKEWPVSLSPNFYDFLYIKGLLTNPNRQFLTRFDAFTDIAFNQTSLNFKKGKSFNCQARSAAIFLSLLKRMSENEIEQYLLQFADADGTDSEQLDLFG